jgi:glycosyltransferase involved in cell wall biosynthesis
LAYVAHYGVRARAVIQRGGTTWVLRLAQSQALFALLLGHQTGDFRRRLLCLLLPSLSPIARREDLSGLIYLNVGHTGLDRSGHSAWIKRTGVKPVYFVHDLIPLTHPEYCRPGEAEKHLRRMRSLLTYGAGVIGNSRDTLNELAIFAGLQATLQMPSSLVAPLGVEMKPVAHPATGSRSTLPRRPYFVMLGTIEGRKNHLLILNIWAELGRRLGSDCPQLIIIGQRGWESEQAVDMLERSDAIRGHVIELSRCDDALLAAYMIDAQALLFPSFVEGYGLPLVEAMASGTPVIASDLAVFRELAGSIPDYLSPIDGLGWMQAIEGYAQPGSACRAAQIARLSGWLPPTWKAHFSSVDQWLKQFQPEPE